MEVLERIFKTVIELGYASTWVILAVLLLRCALRRMPKRYSYLLWAIPAVRLLIPIPFAGVWGMLGSLAENGGGRLFAQVMGVLGSPSELAGLVVGKWAAGGMPGSISMSAGIGGGGVWDNVARIGSHAIAQAAGLANGTIAGGIAGIGFAREVGRSSLSVGNGGAGLSGDANLTGSLGEMPVISVGTMPFSLMQAAAILWMVGMVVFAGWNVVSYIRLKRKLRISVRWEGQVYFADGILQPFVLPGVPCRIYLPSCLGIEGVSHILRHEQIHVRRRDPWLNLLATVILGIYWFHPAVWAGIYYFRRDMEMSCDEAAVAGLDAEGVRAYVLDLLRFSVSQEKWEQFPCAFGEKGVMERMKNLKKGKIKTKAALGMAGVLVAAAALILIPNAKEGFLEAESAKAQIAEGQQGTELQGTEEAQGTELQGTEEAQGTELQGEGDMQEAESLQEIGKDGEAGEAEGIQETGDMQEAEATEEHKKPLNLQESLEQYFAEIYSVLSDDTKNFSSKDFASTDSYMLWKRLQMRRYLGEVLYGGIDNVRLQEVEVHSQEETDGKIEAIVFVKALYDYRIYHGLPKKAKSQEDYNTYKVSVIQEQDGYRILDFSCSDELYDRVRAHLAEGNSQDSADNYAAVDAYFGKLQVFQECLERYFMNLYQVLMDDTKDFSHDDFASTNGYIIGRELISNRYRANVHYNGMAEIKLEEVFIYDISETKDGIEAMTYVIFLSSYGMDPKDLCSEGDMFRVSMIPEGEGYKVVDLDSNSEYPLMAKEGVQAMLGTTDISQDYDAVDDYYEEVDRKTDGITEWKEEDFVEPEK